jgi:predicted dehydrogenase
MTLRKIKWGIISTAKIGLNRVIPGMLKSELCEMSAISSRSLAAAEEAARNLGIEKAYGSYEELLADPTVEAIYNPLPNHLHVPWTIKALEAGKHVLCEKPIALNAEEAQHLLDTSKKYPDLKVMEAFMYRFHPQWIKAKELVDEGAIGEPRVIQSFFSYYNADPTNIRNMADIGGGGLMDIGCYCISFGRYIFEEEPIKAVGSVEYDPILKTDRIASGILEFSEGKSSTFTCSTQLMPYQRCIIFGTEGLIEIEIPVNAPVDIQTRIWLVTKTEKEQFTFDICDQYALQGDAFSRAILNDTVVPTPLGDAVGNMEIIDAIIESGKKSRWVPL